MQDEIEALIQENVGDLPNFRMGGTTTDFEADGAALGVAAETSPDVPDVIRSFIVYFQKNMREGNVHEVHSIYETSFNKLTDRFYKSSPWPPAEAIAPLVDNDQQFLLFYKELYYRHVYAKLQPTLEQRFESWANYCDIFNLLLEGDEPLALDLPNQWLWDLIDEFIYQFQTYCQFRARVKSKTDDELKALRDSPQSWAVQKVVYYLHALAERAEINATLSGEPTSTKFAGSSLYKMVGYFSLVGLLRVHCLLADYRLALQSVSSIDLGKKGLFTRVTACHISIFYYVGFAYLMMRRYSDAVRTFSNILFYIARTKQYHTRSYQYDQIVKKNEQMYALLALGVALCPQLSLDEHLTQTLKEKFSDRISRMQTNNDLGAYEELFSFACPKFITPAAPAYDDLPAGYNPQEAYKLQLRVFLKEVEQQQMLPTIRSFLKLYTTIGIPKLAALLEVDEASFREHLQCLKHKAHGISWTAGAPISGEWASSAEIDFFVDGTMAHVADFSRTRRHSEFFVKQINKLEEIICSLK